MAGLFCKALPGRLKRAPLRALPRLSGKWQFAFWGRSKRGFAMTCKIIAFEFVVPTAMATTLAVMLSIVAVYLTDKYLGPIEQAEAHGLPSAEGSVDQ